MNYLRKQGMGGRAQPTMPPPEQQQIIQQPQQAGMSWACEALEWITLQPALSGHVAFSVV
jgi:hypothetical protein